jgi:dihydrolipoamide dehydrogenase
MNTYDVCVIGAGPGGYVAAIRCAQLGLKTVLVERYASLGGTCLNVGCIPSKALLDSSEHFYNAQHHFQEHGIDIKPPKVNIKQMIERKRGVIKTTVEGINYLMKKNKIDVLHGHARFESAHHICIEQNQTSQTIESKYTIIASGSKPASLPGITIDKKRIITSTEALELQEVPKHMIIIGGGVIGLELGSVYARLGSKISVVEYMDRLIPAMDAALGKELQRVLKKNLGFEFYMKHKVTGAVTTGKSVSVSIETPKGDSLQLEGDYCLVAVGRKPYTDGLDIAKAGITTDERGRIITDAHLKTQAQNIYAIGDVVKGAMLAHKAEEEGVFVAEQIAGQKPHINYLLIPGVVYTWPEVAGVGLTEEE